ncbi:hypothetical protein [Paracraurococcus lichenis]|uniref:Uncharacterized protein n=1 Tax=Paracraurococcus lichenis TaxID=3064888 RepID=A0ABT9E6T9_9PROT|nr:hypothetical protein [Paracraurococcus sp. LOR1-02]MDO9711907.1 hypothetical protein [Paracraurococcus sp. LOR1-02]
MTLLSSLSNITRSEGDPKVLRSGPSSLGSSDRLARGLGWFSIGLGVAELVAPHVITRTLGLEGREGLVRAFGVREIGHGVMSLSVDKQVGVWSRVGGDLLDIATVLPALSPSNRQRGNAELAFLLLLGITVLDLACAQSVSTRHARPRGAVRSYADRSGFPQGLPEARGAARRDFRTPPDMQAPPALARAVA